MEQITSKKIWDIYEKGLNYQREMGFTHDWPMYEDFKMGKQWPAATEKTAHMPRPVMNMISYIINQRKSNVLNSKLKMVYTPFQLPNDKNVEKKAIEGAENFTNLAAALWESVDQDDLNDKVVEDAATNGTGILHYFWDADKNIQGKGIGEVSGEVIDPINIFFSNPQSEDVEKQEFIIISNRLPIEKVINIAKENKISKVLIDEIKSDSPENTYDAEKTGENGQEKVTVLTAYYKKDVEKMYEENGKKYIKKERKVFFVKSVENTLITSEIEMPLTIYPIAKFCWKRRKKSVFGAGEVEGIIPNQKAINFNIAMQLLAVQDLAWPKILIKDGSINQKITNEPGEMIIDYSQTGDGIKYMQTPNFSSMPLLLTDKLTEYTRMMTGVSEVATGDAFTSTMSAAAIIALQNQAKMPIQMITSNFYRTIEKVGRIWQQFFKYYYITKRNVVIDDKGYEIDTGKYKDFDFKLKIDVGSSSSYSESLAMSTLEMLLDKGHIDVDTYIQLIPNTVMPFKEQLKSILKTKQTESAK